MADDNLYIPINYAVQDPWYDAEPHMNGLSFSSNVSVNSYDDNNFMPFLNSNDVPYEDNFFESEVIYER